MQRTFGLKDLNKKNIQFLIGLICNVYPHTSVNLFIRYL